MLNEGYTLPEANICTNANKATTEDEACSTAGNSAWNTITSARTGSQLTLKLLLIQDMLSIFNSVLMVTPSQRLISAPTPTKPPPRMRHAPLLETPLGTPSLPLELESQLMLKPTHTQDILSTE